MPLKKRFFRLNILLASVFAIVIATQVTRAQNGSSPGMPGETRGTVLLGQIAETINSAQPADSSTNTETTAASILYLSEILHQWNPRFTREYIAYLIVGDVRRKGVTAGVIIPMLALVDLSTALGKRELGKNLLNPIITQLNPRIAKLLVSNLHFDTNFPQVVYRSPSGYLDAIGAQMDNMGIGPHYRQDRKSGLQHETTTNISGISDVITGPGSYYSHSARPASHPTPAPAPTAAVGVAPSPGPLSGKSALDCASCMFLILAEGKDLILHPYEGPGEEIAGAIAEVVLGQEMAEKCGPWCGETHPSPTRTEIGSGSQPPRQQPSPKAEEKPEKKNNDVDTHNPVVSGRDPDQRQPDDPLFDKASRTAMTAPDYDGPVIDLPPHLAQFADTGYLDVIRQASFLRVSALQDETVKALRGGFDMKKAIGDLKARGARGELGVPSNLGVPQR